MPSDASPDLAFDDSGRPWSPRYGDVYRSRAGALDEALTVFVDGCELRERWQRRDHFTVLELGFGLAVNFLATVAAWRADPGRPRRLHYVSVERHPLTPDDLARAWDAVGCRTPDADRLHERWPQPLPGLHALSFEDGAVTLTLAFGDARPMVPKLALAADAFYLDGFAPARNPEMWEPTLLRALARLAVPGALLATYSAASPVRAALQDAGFEVLVRPGFGAKRQRIVARYAPRWRTFPPPAAARQWPVREAIVVGAGLAGCATADALAQRGWRVALLERRASVAAEGSGQPMVADHPHLSPDDNVLARLTRTALLGAERGDPVAGGKLLLADGPADAARQHALAAALGFPASFVQALDAQRASDVAGVRIAHGGLWLPGAGAADPGVMCRRWLDRGAGRIELRLGVEVAALRRDADGAWTALDAGDRTLASAPVVVLANAGDAVRLAGLATAALRRVRGQTTRLPAGVLPGLRAVLGGDAYACPMGDGSVLVGATFDDGGDLAPDPQADLSNLRRLVRMLELPLDPANAHATSAVAGYRFVARDRMPLLGALPDEDAAQAARDDLSRNDRLPLPSRPGLYGAFGFGARGRLWAGLGGSLLAAAIDGGPAPLERDLLAVVDPARFLRQRIRRRRR